MGGGEIPKIPDWRTYTIGPHTPELQHTERMLKSCGLKDPWLRNEVWRYDRRNPMVLDQSVRFKDAMGWVPFKYAFGIAIVTAGIRYYLTSGDHGHGDTAHH